MCGAEERALHHPAASHPFPLRALPFLISPFQWGPLEINSSLLFPVKQRRPLCPTCSGLPLTYT